MQREVEALSRALKDFSSPFAAIIGGSKVSTKLEVIQNLGQICDKVITGGGITIPSWRPKALRSATHFTRKI